MVFATLKSRTMPVGNPYNKSGILAIGLNGNPANLSFFQWLSYADIDEPVTIITTAAQIAAVDFTRYKVVYIPSAFINNGGITVRGINETQNNALVLRANDLKIFVNDYGGSLVSLGQSALTKAYGWLPRKLDYRAWDNPSVGVTPDMASLSATSTAANLYHSMWHGYFFGPKDWAGERGLGV